MVKSLSKIALILSEIYFFLDKFAFYSNLSKNYAIIPFPSNLINKITNAT